MAEKNNKRFFKDFKGELKKVIWPTAKQTTKNTIAVIFLVILVSAVVLVFDLVFRKGYDFTVDKVTGGTIGQSKAIFAEMKNYTDENTISLYQQFYSAGYIDLEGLKQALEEMKNPTEETEEQVDVNTETEAQTTEETEPVQEGQE